MTLDSYPAMDRAVAEGMRRLQEDGPEPFTSENSRIISLGPGLFASIVLGLSVILICSMSQYFDKPSIRNGLRGFAFIVLILPIAYFSLVTYADTIEEIAANRKFDPTYSARTGMKVLFVLTTVLAAISYAAGNDAPLTRHKQGRLVFLSNAS